MKLFILDNLSAFSSDTVYKICLTLEDRGLQEENIESFDSYDTMFEALATALEDGEHIIVAAENTDYVAVKNALVSYFSQQGTQNSVIAEAIAKNTDGDLSDIDMEGHSYSPIGAITLLSSDGLYSGFSTLVSSGRLTCLPLDFTRVDSMITTLVDQIISREESLAEMGVEGEILMPDFDLIPTVTDMVNVLYDSEKTLALATGEATMWIYNLYDKVDYLTDTIKFADVESGEAPEAGNESAAVIAKARDAMISVGSDFGGAVSEIYSSYNDEGNIVYYAFAAVVDHETAGAKKINISDPTNLSIMLPHAVTLLSDMMCKKLKSEKRKSQTEATVAPEKKEPVVITPKMIGIIAALLAVIIIPIVLVVNMVGDKNPTTILPPPSTNTPTSSTQPSTNDVFNSTNTPPLVSNTEESAADVDASSTAAPQPSTKGIFTFYVFGYGHGVGMSQTGANYLAHQGWNWSEILSHYYYDSATKIIQGDKYPETVNYSGVDYKTREYLAKALESEMGPSFHTEALKAQCVAIYTFAKYNNFKLESDAHAYDKTEPSQTVYSVVDDVMENGFCIEHNDSTALTPFHAMSAGKTTSYYNVWGKTSETHVSYLAGGRKSYGDYLDDEFKSVYTITSDDLKQLIESNSDLKVNLSGDPSTWLTILSHDQAVREDIGYVSTINVGGMVLTGNDFRIKVMGGRIRSHCFALQYTPV